MLKISPETKEKFFNFVNYIPKRIRIVASLIFMTSLVLISTFPDFTMWWWFFVLLFMLVVYIITYLSVFEGIDGVEWFTLFIMPIAFTLACYLFLALLPSRWLTRLPYVAFFAFGFYALLLTTNIFNVGVEKSLQLYRAAFSVNYLFQTFIVFLFMQVFLSFKQSMLVNSIAIFVISVPLATQLFWTVNPDSKYRRADLMFGLIVGFLLFQLSIMLSFVPLKSSVSALVITAAYYSLTGIIFHHLDQRLFKNVVREYVVVMVLVTAIALLTLQW